MAQLNLAGIITRVVTDLKARFAAIAHNHAAGDITSGTLAIARGGTNAGTAAAARTNLDAAQDASSGTTLYAAQQAISGLAAAQGNVPSGKTLQGEIQTLQDSVGGIIYIKQVDGTLPAGETQGGTFNAPTVQGYTFRFWLCFTSVGFQAACYASYPQLASIQPWVLTTTTSSDRTIRGTAVYTKDV